MEKRALVLIEAFGKSESGKDPQLFIVFSTLQYSNTPYIKILGNGISL